MNADLMLSVRAHRRMTGGRTGFDMSHIDRAMGGRADMADHESPDAWRFDRMNSCTD